MSLSLCSKCLEAIGLNKTAHVVFDVTPDGVVIYIDGKAQPPHPHGSAKPECWHPNPRYGTLEDGMAVGACPDCGVVWQGGGNTANARSVKP